MNKNLIILHLESISQSSFWQFAAELPVLWALSGNSANFRRFYTASTSSVMTMCDMMHGDSAELDHNPVFPKGKNCLAGRSSNLFHVLNECGYITKGIQYGSFCLGDAPNNFWGIWPDSCGQFTWCDKIEAFHSESRQFMFEAKTRGQPFALYHWNMATHIRNDSECGGGELGFIERYRRNFHLLDASVKQLMQDLVELELIENTLIVAYGDHGDDYWRHGLAMGRTHVIEPYSSLCWTPLFIFNNGYDKGIFDSLASSVDIKATVLHMLFPDLPTGDRTSPFAGLDLLSQGREVAFSQSIFALQLEHSDPAKAISKSYAVTDGDLRLMVSSGGNKPEEGGMELFFEQWDFGNTRNLLDFFELDKNGNIMAFNPLDAVHPHFTMSFTPPRITSMVQSYSTLRQVLANFIDSKEKAALEYFQGSNKQLFPMEMFKIARNKRF
jgi:hypothetical protein